MRTYKGVATKVKPDVKHDIKRICKALGMSQYEVLQMMCDCIVRYMDDMHNLSPELELVMTIFEHMDGWKDAFNLADPTCKREVTEAVYVSHDPDGRKHGERASLVCHTPEGWKSTDNVCLIYDRMMEVLLPEVHRKMKAMVEEYECRNTTQLLLLLLSRYEQEEANEEYRRMFEDARADNGKPLAYGRRTKKVKRVTPDEMEADMGFQPIGGEW